MTEKFLEAETLLQNRYRIGHKIGQGGMGAVYMAKDERFGSVVAIKETLFGDENYRKALEREARLLNSLRHPALPTVSDYFVEGKGQYIVMEYIAGEDLAEQLAKNRKSFSLEDVMMWADQLLDALDFLHNQNIPVIHRDIKPQNLKLTKRNQIVLLDFGLAKGNPTDLSHLTTAKSIFGYSPGYASLEQIQGTGTEPRSDLYSLAATLYHLLTGLPPSDALTRAMSVLNDKGDPLRPADQVDPSIPSGVSNILLSAMALNANQRPESATIMREMLADSEKFEGVSEIKTLTGGAAMPTNIFNQDTKLFSSENSRQSAIQTVVLSGEEKQSEISRVTKIADRNAQNTQSVNNRGRYTVGAAIFGVLILLGLGVFAFDAMSDHSETRFEQTVSDKTLPAANNQESDANANSEILSSANQTVEKAENINVETADVSPRKESLNTETAAKKSTQTKKETAKAPTADEDDEEPMIVYDPEVGNIKIFEDKIVTNDVVIESNRMIIKKPGQPVRVIPIDPENQKNLSPEQKRALNQRIFELKMKQMQKNLPKPQRRNLPERPPLPPPQPTPEN